MLRFLTTLSFLYIVTIVTVLLYGYFYYRSVSRNGRYPRIFPFIFLLIGTACFSFLWFNMHPSLKQKTFSNLDHYFLRHDGFLVSRNIELGKNDTAENSTSACNRFSFSKSGGRLTVSSVYSEEPFYCRTAGNYRLLSHVFPASGHRVSFVSRKTTFSILARDSLFEFSAGSAVFKINRKIRKSVTAWDLVKDQSKFISSAFYADEQVMAALRQIILLRENAETGDLNYFIGGRIFKYAHSLKYDDKLIKSADLTFSASVADNSVVVWGSGFSENNRNQYRAVFKENDSFCLLQRYPLSYPLTEEKRTDWSTHSVTKFLLSDAQDILRLPGVFREGFLFASIDKDSTLDFAPVLLTYKKDAGNSSVDVKARWMDKPSAPLGFNDNSFVLPTSRPGVGWIFSVRDTFQWEFSGITMQASVWKLLIFGVLGFFFLMIFLSACFRAAEKQSWVWQLLSCVSLVLLTTRVFMYWRYKSFPPYEGLDLPSLQQLENFWNFGIILCTGFALGLVFGFGIVRHAVGIAQKKMKWRFHRPVLVPSPARAGWFSSQALINYINTKTGYFICWLLVLVVSAAIAAIRDFDPSICRHLAIALVIAYFIFVYLSYRHSPLTVSSAESWWQLSTGKFTDILVSNPVKVFLSVSLLAVFVFVDIGFAIVFANFLLFHEAFLCINYAIAGLSAGSAKNSRIFGWLGFTWLVCFAINLMFAPQVLKTLLHLPQLLYVIGYGVFAFIMAANLLRLRPDLKGRKQVLTGMAATLILFVIAFFFFPKEKIVQKAEVTQYRIDVLTMPVDKAISAAYEKGDSYEPVIRAAQNQWFINTFIDGNNNPGVHSTSFQLLPHAPQNKGAKYNAQATDLVASRFFIAEHGTWSVLLFIFILLLPSLLLASFYKLYPDFTNRINNSYPAVTAGFTVLNFILITALLVVLAATGRYIFFGQDLPFGSILSKQSILFPSMLITGIVLLFRNIPAEHYANRGKFIPGTIVFSGLGLLLFFAKPAFNNNKEFSVGNLAEEMNEYTQLRLQPILDHFDTSRTTRRLSTAKKDLLFTDSLRRLIASGALSKDARFFTSQAESYASTGFSSHLDQRHMVFLNLYSGRPQLDINENYFRVMPPPHLRETWTGNVYGDSSLYHISLWNAQSGTFFSEALNSYTSPEETRLSGQVSVAFRPERAAGSSKEGLYLFNRSSSVLQISDGEMNRTLSQSDSLLIRNPSRIMIADLSANEEKVLVTEPGAFMKNYYVNGSRYYAYPMGNRFTWARNFAESISSSYTSSGRKNEDAFISVDYNLMDSLTAGMQDVIGNDTAYKKGAEYGICVADGNGRIIAMADFIKELDRPDPNHKQSFQKIVQGEEGYISQSLLRKQVGNLNLLRMNPGPGSTLKPIVFSAIASQMKFDWTQFESEGFTAEQKYFGGEKVAGYDFEKNNGRINNLSDFLRLSDNYYYSNLLLLGSYPKQDMNTLLESKFSMHNDDSIFHWPYFRYQGKSYWLDGYRNWPGYENGKADFGNEQSFVSTGLRSNYDITASQEGNRLKRFGGDYDSLLFLDARRSSAFIFPEYGLFDQRAATIDHHIPYDVFAMGFRGHVKGSSQVLIAPVKMLDAFGRLVTQNRDYKLTLDPYAKDPNFRPFEVDSSVGYENYLSIIREDVFAGMREALYRGTAARLGSFLKQGTPWFYYAKTGTTGDDELKTKSKLFTIIISSKDISRPDFNFRDNKFYVIYFTSQNGPAKQNEELQAKAIKMIEESPGFRKYMKE
jgi:hypothetical protein